MPLLLAFAVLALTAEPASAHAMERAFVLLLPTGLVMAGGTAAVVVSFAVLALVPARALQAIAGHKPEGAIAGNLIWPSCSSFAFLCFLIVCGLFGSRDPLENPLPLTIWVLWWVGFTLLQAIVGDLWRWLNPWSGPARLVQRALGLGGGPWHGLLRYPGWLDHWPAVASFLAFAWIEIVSLAPSDPMLLAETVGLYVLGTFAGVLVFGETAWLGKAEAFSVYFRLVGQLSPIVWRGPGRFRFPGAGLVAGEAVSLSLALFVLLTLASVSFDGLSHTFWWLSWWGINPLEFPGRSGAVTASTLGLVGAWVLLAALFLASVAAGAWLAGEAGAWLTAFCRFAPTLIPISLAYHLAHYLTALLVNGQDAIVAFNDPFGQEVDLLGLGWFRVSLSVVNDWRSVSVIFALQSLAIVTGHILAVVLAHAVSLRTHASPRLALLAELPLAVFMVAYTLLGLWLLATPVAG